MRFWLACFGVLFALAELYQWMKHLTLPLPIYILSGALLAIASNYNKQAGLPWREQNADSEPLIGTSNPTPQQPLHSLSFTITRSPEQPQQPEKQS